jgi:hypothetical protein
MEEGKLTNEYSAQQHHQQQEDQTYHAEQHHQSHQSPDEINDDTCYYHDSESAQPSHAKDVDQSQDGMEMYVVEQDQQHLQERHFATGANHEDDAHYHMPVHEERELQQGPMSYADRTGDGEYFRLGRSSALRALSNMYRCG